jgi:multiple sugar transport system permease protein
MPARPPSGMTRLGVMMRKRRELLFGILFASPWILGFLVFTLYPLLSSLYYSFTSYHITGSPRWVGWGNFQEMFTQDDLFWISLQNSAIYTLVSVPLDVTIALLLAVMLNMEIPGRKIFRTIFFLPQIVPIVVMAILFAMLFSTQGGLINDLLGYAGISPVPWLSSPDWAMRSLILMTTWGVGNTMVIFLAGLQDVPGHLYEAARLDGAGSLGMFRHVTIPMISPVILFNVVLNIIGSFQTFILPFIVTNGGPLNSTMLYPLQVYQNAFQNFRMGYASAEAWFMFVIIFVLTLLTLRLSRGVVHYS